MTPISAYYYYYYYYTTRIFIEAITNFKLMTPLPIIILIIIRVPALAEAWILFLLKQRQCWITKSPHYIYIYIHLCDVPLKLNAQGAKSINAVTSPNSPSL